MEITQADLRIGDYTTEFIDNLDKHEKNEDRAWISDDSSDRCDNELERKNTIQISNSSIQPEPNLNSIQHEAPITESAYSINCLDGESFCEELSKCTTEIVIKKEENLQNNYSISTVVIPSDILVDERSFSIKRESTDLDSDWSIEETKKNIITREPKKFSSIDSSKKNSKRRRISRANYHESLRKKAECMREKRKKLYQEESEESRIQRLSREAAKRRETRMYYESPEERRKRLDTDAARKREYRMYNETPDERRNRLDREAERRRLKRLAMSANETNEQKRERLSRESSKRREARSSQYARESDEQRHERLRRDALRAREMRFTRSAIETEEERRDRLVKDALRKRELRNHGSSGTVRNFTELQSVRNFQELNNSPIKDDNQTGGHYLGNWMMWFQNTVPTSNGESSNETQQTDI